MGRSILGLERTESARGTVKMKSALEAYLVSEDARP